MTGAIDDGEQQTVTIAWGGDVNIGRRFHYCFTERAAAQALATIPPLRNADLSIVNLECVIATCGAPADKGERASYYFRARPEMVETLVNGGVDIVATANNHSGDYGPEALLEQARWLAAAGIGHAGSGPTLADAWRPVIRKVGGLNIALFSFDATQASFAATHASPGHAHIELTNPGAWRETLSPLIADARRGADLILVAVHWGANNRAAPCSHEIAAGHAIIDAGADAVLGASAHMLQGVEIYQGRPIIHDAGDLLFDAFQRGDAGSGVFTLEATGNGVRRVRFTPLRVDFCKTSPLEGEEALALARRLAVKCAGLQTVMTVTETGEGVIELPAPARKDLPQSARAAEPTPAAAAPAPPAILAAPPRGSDWSVDQVPADAAFATPIRLGPLELLGALASPKQLDHCGLICVESFWRLAEDKTADDWRIEFQAVPYLDSGQVSGISGAWGASSDHDPCDWMWPTSRWESGVIYRDAYTLRPPAVRRWLDGALKLSVRLKQRDIRTKRVALPVEVRFALSRKEAFRVLRENVPVYGAPAPETLPQAPQILWSAEQIQRITGGAWLTPPPGFWFARSVSHKPRMLVRDDMPGPRLFFATDQRLVARHELYTDMSARPWDSHARLPELQRSLAGAVVARPLPGLDPRFPLLQVEDPLHALMQLGVAGRNRLQAPVVAITGSAGKTSLTSMMTLAMSVDKKVSSNASSNYNSRVGLLHLLANTLPDTSLVVLEAAVSAINAPNFQNIRLVRPDIAIVTNIAPSHLPPGKGLAYVAQRKANIFEGMSAGGTALIWRETPCFDDLRKRAEQRGLRVLSYGQMADADFRLLAHDAQTGAIAAATPDGRRYVYALAAKGLHMALNSLACIAVRHLLGNAIEPILPALGQYQAASGRGRSLQAVFRGKSITVIDDSYNANPLSMRMALSLARASAGTGRKVLVLGDMAELGDQAIRHHVELADDISQLKPDCVLACGPLMRHLWTTLSGATGASPHGGWFENVDSLMHGVDHWLVHGDHILVKGSNSMNLGQVVELLCGDRP
ncbi:CapA family protein [Camelimonas sp. ID_303_24]